MERKFYFAYFQGDQMLGFVVDSKNHFPFLYLQLGFAYDTKETGCCGCSIWACWRLRESISTTRSLCSRFFSHFSLQNAMYPSSLFRPASIVILSCLTDESASAFNPLAISLRACLFDLICFEFLWRATTVLRFFLGASWLTGFT